MNFFGLTNVMTVLPHVRARKSGTVVMIGNRSAWGATVPVSPGVGRRSRSLNSADIIILSSSRQIHISPAATITLNIAETLAVEFAPFSVLALVVEPRLFQTEGIYALPFFTAAKPIADYDIMREWDAARSSSLARTQRRPRQGNEGAG